MGRSATEREVAGSIGSRLAGRVTIPAAEFFRARGLDHPRALFAIWAVIRILVCLVWALVTPETQGDVVYYYEHIDHMLRAHSADVMREYPTPVLWLLTLPWLLGFGTRPGYVTAFVVLMIGLDAAFSVSLWRHGGSLRAQAVATWSLFVGFIGPTMYLRFDIVTTVLAGWSLLGLLSHRDRLAGALSGLGAAVKLWPALLWPALCHGDRNQAKRASIGFWVAGGGLALASLIVAGWDRLVSPLSWQSGRGLQVESIWATIPMLARSLRIGDYAVVISRFQAFEIYGPGVNVWMSLSTVATVVGLLGVVVAYLAWLLRPRRHLIEAAVFMLLVIVVMIVTNKTFSPQYMIWIAGAQAAALALLGNEDRSEVRFWGNRRRLLTLTAGFLAATVLTGIVFPIGYDPLVRDSATGGFWRLPITIVLAARNILMLGLAAQLVRWVLTFTRRP